MKLQYSTLATLASTLITFASLASGANGAVTLSNLTLTERSLSFDISGTLPDSSPADVKNTIWLYTFDTKFITSGFDSSTSKSGANVQRVYKNNDDTYGQYIGIQFDSNLIPNQSLSGTYSASWGKDVFINMPDNLTAAWGSATFINPPSDGSGQVLGSFAVNSVPEPSSALLLGLGGLSLVLRRKRTA